MLITASLSLFHANVRWLARDLSGASFHRLENWSLGQDALKRRLDAHSLNLLRFRFCLSTTDNKILQTPKYPSHPGMLFPRFEVTKIFGEPLMEFFEIIFGHYRLPI